MAVYLIQCLCPQRHCIAAIAYEADEPSEEYLVVFKTTVAQSIAGGNVDPWCGICKSRDWHCETGKTPYRTMEEAREPLAALAAEQAQAREFFKQSKN